MTAIGFDSEKIIRYFDGKYSDKDASYVHKVFCDDNTEEELRPLLLRQFDESLLKDDTDEKNLDHILHRIHFEINSRSATPNAWYFDTIIKWTLRIAGIIILPLIIFLGIQWNKDAYLKRETWVEIKAPAWTRAQFRLPDGTTGWLNSNSSVKYNGNFIADRKVTLNGEAFFDVFKDSNRPFVVAINEVSVKVLGTRFNIASYENEKSVEVVLEEGKLVFNNQEMNKSYTMHPNDMVIYDKTLKNFSTEVVQPQKYVSWTNGKLVFRNDPLDVIARRLERWYNIDVKIQGSLTEDLRLRATFSDENLEEVLNLLKRSLPIDYRIENRGINPDGIYPKKRVIILPRMK